MNRVDSLRRQSFNEEEAPKGNNEEDR